MSAPREVCTVTGKECIPTKQEARNAVRALRARRNGKGGYYRCPFGEHYHVTKGLRGLKGKGDFR